MKALIKSVVSTRAAACAILIGASSIGVAPAIHNDAFAQDMVVLVISQTHG